MLSPKLRTTEVAKFLIILSGALFVCGFFLDNLFYPLGGLVLLSYLVYCKFSFSWKLHRLQIKVERHVLEKIKFANVPFTVILKFSLSEGFIWCQLEDQLPADCQLRSGDTKIKSERYFIVPKHEYTLKYTVVPKARGYFQFETMKLQFQDRSNLFLCNTDLNFVTGFRVHSDKESIVRGQIIARHMQFERAVPSRTGRLRSMEFEGIRPYRPGDRLRDIEWKATSRLTKLMTKIFQKEMFVPVYILLDCSRSMRLTTRTNSKLEHMIGLVLQMVKILQIRGNPVGMIAFDDYNIVSSREPSMEPGHYENILYSLLTLPNRIQVETYEYRYEVPRTITQSEAEQKFISTISPFVLKKRIELKAAPQLSGIYQAVQFTVTARISNALLLIFSDMESNPEALAEALKLIEKKRYKCYIISPFSWWYTASYSSLTPELLEQAYREYMEKTKYARQLRARGIKVIDLAPLDDGKKVMELIK